MPIRPGSAWLNLSSKNVGINIIKLIISISYRYSYHVNKLEIQNNY